jgi:hypothetical protein
VHFKGTFVTAPFAIKLKAPLDLNWLWIFKPQTKADRMAILKVIAL